MIAPIDLKSILANPLPPVKFIIPGLEKGLVGVISAPGGTGKSFLLLEIAVSVALREKVIFDVQNEKPYRVLYMTFEEKENHIAKRIKAIAETFPFVNEKIDDLANNLFVYPCLGRPLDLYCPDGYGRDYSVLEELVRESRPDFLILDPLSKLHTCDENSNVHMSHFMSALTRIANDYSCAILVSHHSSKGSVLNGQNDTQQSGRGASAIYDDARWGATLHRPQNGDKWTVYLDVPKLNNYAPLETIKLKRQANGVLLNINVLEKLPVMSLAEKARMKMSGEVK